MRATSSDCVFAARAAFGWTSFFAALGFGEAVFALRGFAGRTAFAALAFFGADLAPVVLRVRIQILRSAQAVCLRYSARSRTFSKSASDRAPHRLAKRSYHAAIGASN
jgi:hypothetical protein